MAREAAGLGLRVDVAGPESGTLNRRIRSSRLVPYQAVIGEREAAAGQVAVRLRDGRRLPPLPAGAALAGIAAHVAAHRNDLWEGQGGQREHDDPEAEHRQPTEQVAASISPPKASAYKLITQFRWGVAPER